MTTTKNEVLKNVFNDKEFSECLSLEEKELKHFNEMGISSRIKVSNNLVIQEYVQNWEKVDINTRDYNNLTISNSGDLGLMMIKHEENKIKYDYIELDNHSVKIKGSSKEFNLVDKNDKNDFTYKIEEFDFLEEVSSNVISKYKRFYSFDDMEYSQEVRNTLNDISNYNKDFNSELSDIDNMIQDRKKDIIKSPNNNNHKLPDFK